MPIKKAGRTVNYLLSFLCVVCFVGSSLGQATWTSHSFVGPSSINCFSYGNNLYVAAGFNSALFTSSDAATWTACSTFSTAPTPLTGLAYGNNIFVAMGVFTPAVTSTNGVNWSANTTLGTMSSFIRTVIFVNNLFIAAGTTPGTFYTSTNGTTWASHSSGLAGIKSICFGNNVYVAVNGAGAIRTTPDLNAWTDRTSGTTSPLTGIAFGNNTFTAVGNAGTVLTSTDGVTWTLQPPVTTNDLNGITFGNGVFAAVSAGGTIHTSPDGVNWMARTSGTTSPLYCVSFCNNTFLAGGYMGKIYTSPCASFGSLNATIYNASTSATISGVTVRITLGETQSQTTNASGIASLLGLLPGNYKISITMPGYAPDTGIAVTIVGGQATNISRFLTPLPAPVAPGLVAPANSAINVVNSPTFAWNTITGASTYRIQASLSSGFIDTVFNISGLNASQMTTSLLPYNSVIYWHVNATNTSGTSPWSTTWSFTTAPPVPAAPVQILPANGATGISLAPTLSWNSSAGTAFYKFQVSTGSNFSSTILDKDSITITSSVLSGLSPSTLYYWKGNARNANGTSSWSNVWSFTTLADSVPNAPALVSPTDGATGVPSSPTLTWGSIARATSYRLQVSNSSSFTILLVDQSGQTGTSSVISSLQNNMKIYWRVNASNSGGTSNWSPTWSFTTAPPVPATPVLTTPANSATDISLASSLTWGTVTGAATYCVQVSTISTFASTIINDSTLALGTKALTGLTNFTTYYWRVNAKNGNGASPWSLVFSFTTIPQIPGTPVLTSPVNGWKAGTLNPPPLTWSTVSGAATYRVQVSGVSTFASVLFDDSTLTTSPKSITTINTRSVYYWRVNAKNVAGTSGWSTIFSFQLIDNGIATPIPHYLPAGMGHNGYLEVYTPNGSKVMNIVYSASATKVQLLNTASKSLAKGYYSYRFRSDDAKVDIVGKFIK